MFPALKLINSLVSINITPNVSLYYIKKKKAQRYGIIFLYNVSIYYSHWLMKKLTGQQLNRIRLSRRARLRMLAGGQGLRSSKQEKQCGHAIPKKRHQARWQRAEKKYGLIYNVRAK